MHAILVRQHGGPESLLPATVADPVPGPGEAVVRVRACALNHLDLFLRQGIPGVEIGLPRILGADMAGEIAALGPLPGPAPDWRVGDRVVVAPGVGCGLCAACLDGRDNECPRYTVYGYRRDGGYAQAVLVPLRSLVAVPAAAAHLDATALAAVPLVFLTAWNMLVVRARLRPGQSVLVWAASSGVGSAAIQIARYLRCRVAATAGGDAKVALARRLGADLVLDHYAPEPVSARLKREFPGGVDVVVEHTGQATWEQSLRSLAAGGALVTCGATTGYAAALDLRFLFSRQLRLLGSYMGRRADVDRVLALVGEGVLHPVVDRVFPLAEAAAAHRYLEDRRQFGKVVLRVD